MIYFFGYGANRDPQMMKAIIGRTPEGENAKVSGFELCVQKWHEIPTSVRKILYGNWHWDDHFRSYILRPSKNMDKIVKGIIWEITPQERKLIDNWEETGHWYHVFFMTINRPRKIQLEIQVINNPKIKQVVSGINYKTFLNPKEKMLEVATACRLEYLRKNSQKIS